MAAVWVALAFGILGLLALAMALNTSAAAIRIQRRGIPLQGQVDEIVGIASTGRVMRFRWTGGAAAVHIGISRMRGRKGFAEFPAGTPIRLLEDPVKPAWTIWDQDLH